MSFDKDSRFLDGGSGGLGGGEAMFGLGVQQAQGGRGKLPVSC
jgi:hypothetical protein